MLDYIVIQLKIAALHHVMQSGILCITSCGSYDNEALFVMYTGSLSYSKPPFVYLGAQSGTSSI